MCTVSESAKSMFGQFVLSRLGDKKQMDLNAQLDTVHFETIARQGRHFGSIHPSIHFRLLIRGRVAGAAA